MSDISRRRVLTAMGGALVAGVALPHVRLAAAFTAPGYRYYDYSRAEWGANPTYDGRLDLFYPQNYPPTTVDSFDLDTGIDYTPTIQPGQHISVADPVQVPTGLGLHYTATDAVFDVPSAMAQLRGIQEYHALEDWGHVSYGPDNPDPRKEITNDGIPDSTFGDIGYHFLIDGVGNIYEGRAGGIFRKGIHIYRHNRGLVGIALIGDFTYDQPPPAQYAALVRLCSRLCRDLHINPHALWLQPLLDGSTEGLSKNGQAVYAVDGHINFPDNTHIDPGVIDLNGVRADIAARLADGDALTFPQTGQTLAEPFRSYWEDNGGLAIFGYPISPVVQETNPDDGKSYPVQYFERNRFELHPELVGTAYYILLGRLGAVVAAQSRARTPAPFAARGPLGANEPGVYFAQTGHTLRFGFLDYWNAHGGLAIFGYPLCEEFNEPGEGGIVYTVQYFERARFEYHPEAPPDYRVLLGRLGAATYTPKAASLQMSALTGTQHSEAKRL